MQPATTVGPDVQQRDLPGDATYLTRLTRRATHTALPQLVAFIHPVRLLTTGSAGLPSSARCRLPDGPWFVGLPIVGWTTRHRITRMTVAHARILPPAPSSIFMTCRRRWTQPVIATGARLDAVLYRCCLQRLLTRYVYRCYAGSASSGRYALRLPTVPFHGSAARPAAILTAWLPTRGLLVGSPTARGRFARRCHHRRIDCLPV